jgi:hypothetical protein
MEYTRQDEKTGTIYSYTFISDDKAIFKRIEGKTVIFQSTVRVKESDLIMQNYKAVK